MAGADGGWRDWWVAAVSGVSAVGEAAVIGVPVSAGDGVAGFADGRGWEGGPVSWWFVRCRGYRSTVLLSVVFLRAVRLLAGSVVGDALVFSACGSWS